MSSTTSRARFLAVLFGLACVWMGLQAPLATAPAAEPPEAAPEALNDWSREVWTSAMSRSNETVNLLQRLPEPAKESAGPDYAAAVTRYRENLGKREEARDQRLAEVSKELDEAAAKPDLMKGLKAAIEMYTLAKDKAEVVARPEVKSLVEKAEAEARKAESEGRWLDAHNLFARLHLLFEEKRTYEADVRRLGQRRVMLRLYVPEQLHQMLSDQRVAEGEQPLPPYNKLGEDWHEKLKDVEEGMVLRSIGTSAQMHVDRVPLAKMLVGGYRAVHTMVTTDDLKGAFPKITDEAKRDEFLRFVDGKIEKLSADQDGANFTEVIAGLRRLQAVNTQTVAIPKEALLHEFANGAIGELDDFSAIIWPDELAQFERTTEGSFKGVGIQISMTDAMEIKVVTPLEGTPAARAGIRPNDLIRRVDGEPTLGMNLNQAVDRITGPEGTKVTLGIEREGVEGIIDYELKRAEIPIYTVKGWQRTGAKETEWDWFIDRTNRIGYVRISQFTNKTTAELRNAVEQMTRSGLKGLILDLRGNPGGLLSEAVGVSSLFVNHGVVVTQEDNQGHERERQTAQGGDAPLSGMPVAVLINGGSASASEIVAGCLQDYRCAVLVGERSFGKGSVQNVFGLGAKAAFKLTTQYYRLPGVEGQPGRLIHRRPEAASWGIEPDVNVEILPKQFADAYTLRQDADIVEFDDQGKLVPRHDAPDPSRLVTEGLDPQLETALLLIQSQTISGAPGARAALH